MYPATLFIVLYLCLAQHCSINCAVIGDRDALWSFLLDLHIEYCGEIDVCHMANHTEPSVDLFPLPCCVPCSCRATCESNQNCCPSRMRFKSISDVTTTPSDSDEQVIMTLEGTQMDNMFNNTSTQKVQKDSSVLNGDNFRQTNRNDNGQHSEDLETTKEFHTETLFDNLWEKTTPCAVSAVNQPNERLNNTSYTNESSLKNIAMYYSVKFACLRPQLLYRLNRHPNSEAYEMVISCPEDFKDTVIVEKCRAGQNHINIADVIPMTSKLTGLTYVNKYSVMSTRCSQNQLTNGGSILYDKE